MKKVTENTIENWFIRQNPLRLDSHLLRLKKLKSIRAPGVVVNSLNEKIEEIRKQIEFGTSPSIRGMDQFGNLIYDDVERKTGRGGNKYFSFLVEKRIVNFFPSGKYGAFISEQQKGEKDEN